MPNCECGGQVIETSGKFFDVVLINYGQCVVCGGCYYTGEQLAAIKHESRIFFSKRSNDMT